MTDTGYAITPGQIRSLTTFLKVVSDDRACHLYITSAVLDRPLVSLAELTAGEWRKVRDLMYPRWRDEDWTPGQSFVSRCADLRNRYMEEVIGQKRLF